MAYVTTQQLAELLLGVARAQYAIIEAMENSKAGFKSTHFRPSLESASRIRSNRPEALTDFPARVLLQMLGRNGPDAEQVAKDLDELISAMAAAQARAQAAAQPAAQPAAPAEPPDEASSLDMTQEPAR
jgi:hypothetical protein